MHTKKLLKILGFMLITSMVFTSCEKLNPLKPQACFTVPDEIAAGTPVNFNSSCSDNASSFSWSFGDGDVSTEPNPSHTYDQGGTYMVTLTVADGAGLSDEASQSVLVTAPAVMEHSGTILENETWIEGMHLITGDVYVNGAILTIEPGATIMIKPGNGLYMGYHSGYSGAILIANGTASKPITFTSSSAIKSAGDWDFIGFYQGSTAASSMQYCVVEYGGGYSSGIGEIHVEGTSVTIENSTIRHSGSYGISLDIDGFFQSFTGNTVTENGSSAITLYGNHVHTLGAANNIVSESGIRVQGDRVEETSATWLRQTSPYILTGDLFVGSETGSELILEPGVEIRITSGNGIYVAYYSGTTGTLTAEGTEAAHIKFTSAAPAGSKSPGGWDYLGFYSGAGDRSSLAYCDIEYGGGYSNNIGMIDITGAGLSITNSRLTNSQTTAMALDIDSWFVACSGNTFEGNAVAPISIYGNYVHTIGSGNDFVTGPGIVVKGDRIEQTDITWKKLNTPYVITGDTYLGSQLGAKLNIEAGTTVKFAKNTGFYVGYYSGTFGVLHAMGTSGNEVVFTSGAPAGYESAGDWDGIWFYNGTANTTVLDHCIISYGGGYSSNSGNLYFTGTNAGVPDVSNCRIENSAAYGIYLSGSVSPLLSNNSFTGNALGDTNQ